MKKILLAISGGLLLFSGCKEIGPAINLSKASGVDSAWVLSTVPAADAHNILIEEFSGQSCANCPAGHATVASLETGNPGRINTICMYLDGIPQANPITPGSKYDFQDSVATIISKYVTGDGVGALPSAFIDRIVYPGFATQEIDGGNAWPGIVATRLPVADSVNIAVQSSYNTTTMTATITATVVYTQPTATKQNLSVVVVEDSMYDLQEDGLNVDTNYLFNSVFSSMLSSAPAGDPILDTIALKPAGQAYKHTYTYTPKSYTPTVVPAHFRVIAFVNSVNGTDYHVMQSAQTKLTGP